MQPQTIIWDNHGTVTGAKNPNDTSSEKVILPNVIQVMRSTPLNIICSGTKTNSSELHSWDPMHIINQSRHLMTTLPISIVTFSPAIGGIECWVIIKHTTGDLEIRKAHEDLRYAHLIGHFKKPGIGMLVVIQDLVAELFCQPVDAATSMFIGDEWPDQHAAATFGIPFIDARKIHTMQPETHIATLVGPISTQSTSAP